MGGRGSGRWVQHNLSKSTTDAECCLSITALKQSGCLRHGASGTVQWSQYSNFHPISFHISGNQLLLKYDWKQHDGNCFEAKQLVKVERRSCYLGGYRTWFCCPRCNRRTSALFIIAGIFRCRICHGLTYSSQKANKIDRLILKIDKIYQKLGASNTNVFGPTPTRPFRMHRSKYLKLIEKAEETRLQIADSIIERFGPSN